MGCWCLWFCASSLASTNQLRLYTHDNFGDDLIFNPRQAVFIIGIKAQGLVQEQLLFLR